MRIFLRLIASLLLSVPSNVFAGQTVQDSITLATGQFPALKDKDSPLNKHFIELVTAARSADPAFDHDAYWPLRLARQADAELQPGWPTNSIEQIQLEEAKRLAALRSEGLSKKETESQIQLGSLVKQRKLLEGRDQVGQQKVDVRIAQINQQMDKGTAD